MRRLVPVLIVVLLAGCFGSPVEDSFADADERFFGGSEGIDVTFAVPPGNVTVVVAVHYLLEEGAELTSVVSVVDGPELANIDQVGPVEEKDRSWLTIHNVTAGTWQIEGTLEGDGSYLFAVYFQERT